MRNPTLLLTVGSPACGKTTAARRFEAEHSALRLTKDDWVKARYGRQNPAAASDVIEGRRIAMALRAVRLGANVVVDFGLLNRDERSALRDAGNKTRASVVLWHTPISIDEQPRRNERRVATDPQATSPMSEHELDAWTASFDEPPPGFTTWPDWMAHRWPVRLCPRG